MTPRSLAMSPDEQQQFLADLDVGNVVHNGRNAAAPAALPVWHANARR